MICPRCRNPMKEERRSFHKQRKWICPSCGKVRMQPVRTQTKSNRREGRNPKE